MAQAQSTPIAITTIGMWVKAARQKKNINNPQFLKETKFFLLSCVAAEKVKPIFSDWEKTPITNKTIEAIFRILIEYHVDALIERNEASAKRNNWTVRIFGSDVQDGPIEEKGKETFKTGWEAEQFAIRRLCAGCSGSNYYALIDAHTEKTELRIERSDALARNEKRKIAPACTDQVKVSKERLSFGVGGQYNKKFYFSRG